MFQGKIILCLGDIMLDRFVRGSVERISPEAPIPILKWEGDAYFLGGVGNVARNISSLGGKAIIVSVIGRDNEGSIIRDLCNQNPLIEAFFIEDNSRKTTKKERFCSAGHQILRLDCEDSHGISLDLEEEILQFCLQQKIDGLILSDYGKGVLTPALCQKIIQNVQVPVFVDPKGKDYSKYCGADFITPNEKEFKEWYGQSLEDSKKSLPKSLEEKKWKGLLVTQGAGGMTLVTQDQDFYSIPAQAQQVYDVSGAGDTVIATLSLCIACGFSLKEACSYANKAAGIVVGKLGTASISKEELFGQPKLLSLERLKLETQQWKQNGLTIGFTNGCFDLLHLGHLSLLKEASCYCDVLLVGLNSDDSVCRLKGPTRPIQNEQTRASVLASLSCVQAVVLFDEDTPYHLIEVLKPDVLFKGADYEIQQICGADLVQSYGGKVHRIPLKEGHSTTNLVQRFAS